MHEVKQQRMHNMLLNHVKSPSPLVVMLGQHYVWGSGFRAQSNRGIKNPRWEKFMLRVELFSMALPSCGLPPLAGTKKEKKKQGGKRMSQLTGDL